MKNIYRLENKLKKKNLASLEKTCREWSRGIFIIERFRNENSKCFEHCINIKTLLKRPNYLVESITFKLPHLIFLFHDIFISFLNFCEGIGGK